MAELSSRDRDFVNIGDELRDLVNHPAWKTYEHYVLDSAITELTNEILNGDSLDPAFLQSIRYTLRAFKAIKQHPYEYVERARSIRFIEPIEGEMNAA